MKKILVFIFISALVFACGSEQSPPNSSTEKKESKQVEKVDDGKGVGPIKNVKLNSPLIGSMVEKGKGIYEMKCAACHKLTDQRVVGPGWKGLTEKRKPEWIMNMTMNIEEMLQKDDEAKKLLKECLVRMPNQNLSKQDAREVLEFMYSIDGQEVSSK